MSIFSLLVLMMIVAIVAMVVIGLWLVGLHNSLKAAEVEAYKEFADVGVQLQRRHNLVPRLLEMVRGYAIHEQQTLEAVIRARGAAVAATGERALGERTRAENELEQGLGRLLVLAEAYPELKADAGFLRLQAELSEIEKEIVKQSDQFNERVHAYTALRGMFPNIVGARILRFDEIPFLGVGGSGVPPIGRIQR